MSLNWKEINLILDELELPGSQIQKAIQSAYDVLSLRLYGKKGAQTLLICLAPGACRLHETFAGVPKNDKPLRFAEFLNSRIVNGRIEEAIQLGDNRIVRITVRQGEEHFRIYIRLWSNAANVIVTDGNGTILDAMKRLPKKGEVSGGHYAPEETPDNSPSPKKEYQIRELSGENPDGEAKSFNEKIDAFYRQEGGALSLDALREQARRNFEGSIGRLKASLEKLKAKEADFASGGRFKEYGDILLANMASIKPGDEWLEAENFHAGGMARIRLDPKKSPAAIAEDYYDQYRKAKNGLEDIRIEINAGEGELAKLEETLARLLEETNPLNLNKLLKTGGRQVPAARKEDAKRPGLSFRRKDWLLIVGRDAAENDALLRRHVKGNDLWLHARDYPGSYVFIKQRAGKTVPLDILLDAGNLAIFYSKGRNNGEGDLFYTHVKYLRRAKDGPKGLVLPTQEKNLHVKVEAERLRELETCRIEK
ncbi:NFACT RNA binding domain-containing protein [Leadbettera azotonutricia]|uniref:Putative fibronectin/fibrinogen-binding protein n=1 Tax=Leadbettera azotonutricia (strain ATCC BAA-888 / DSM 13862 / ZAS-9) TaxID=545695 RepID=F5Y780_LEAAZ|nr:NFACT family protein [Leadbettera azotonutricia]AEF80319.1 putative fibronectin/fibrinogen-binding protein [Leadbettera azotonutricia ZAS-9]